MKITMFSNFMNHHQLPFCKELRKILGDDFKFVATERIPKERTNMGYKDMNSEYNFIIKSYDNEEEAYKLGMESDVVLIGSAPKKYIKKRLKMDKGVTIAYSERIFKRKDYKLLLKCIYYRFIKERIQNNNYYLLCASAYATSDYNSISLFRNKTYKWGYFPEVKEYKDINKIMNNKENNTILWVARFLDWKHPEIPIEIAKRLKTENISFSINMIGIGEMYDQINTLIKESNLEKNVKTLGSMSPENVRKYMEKSKIFIFTSDRGEGWGAVLNEAMNSGCAVVASHEIGSVPFLIKDKKNGLIYEDGNIDDLYNKVKLLLDNDKLTKKIGLEGYNSMIKLWNPRIAAKRFIELSETLLKNEQFNKYDDGPCSIAYLLKDNWYL